MRLALRLGGFVFEGGFFKTKKVVGVSSYRPTSHKFHNILCDIDGDLPDNIKEYADYITKTPKGYHAYKFGYFSLRDAFNELIRMGADRKYAVKGFERGYWFLESYKPPPIYLLKELSFMEIERVAKNYHRVHRLAFGQRRNHKGRVLGLLGA